MVQTVRSIKGYIMIIKGVSDTSQPSSPQLPAACCLPVTRPTIPTGFSPTCPGLSVHMEADRVLAFGLKR